MSADPYLSLEVGHSVCLSSPLVDPIHWQNGKVLWRDDMEVLVETSNFSGKYEKRVEAISYVRIFGTREFCEVERRKAEAAVRDAARISREVEDMASELRRKMVDLFEVVAARALEASRGETAAASHDQEVRASPAKERTRRRVAATSSRERPHA